MKWMGLVFGLLSLSSYADTFFTEHERGWYWYEIIPEEAEVEAGKDSNGQSVNRTSSPLDQLKQLQQTLETAKAKAVLTPTETNVRDYISLQNTVAKQSAQFAATWQQVLWKNPELDYSLIKPTGLLAKQAYLDSKKVSFQHSVSSFAKSHGLWFFFRSDCGYCHRFAPILKRISDKYGFAVMAISLDGGVLPEFPNAAVNAGQAERLGVQGVPALFAVNPKNEEIMPITHGLVSEGELIERIWALTTQEEVY